MKLRPSLKVASSAFALLLAASAAQAQNYFSTNFDGSQIVNDVQTGTTYASPNTPTDPIVGQGAGGGQGPWFSNDGAVVNNTGGSTQVVGNSNFVGPTTFFTGQVAALGGVYRTTAPTAAAPDVVPSVQGAPQGIVSLFHGVSLTPVVSNPITFQTDFAITQPGLNGFGSKDTFSLTLGNSSTNLLSINFSPATVAPGIGTQDIISYTTGGSSLAFGGATTTPGGAASSGIVLNDQYRLTVTITPGTGAFQAIVTGTNTFSFNGTVGGPVTAASITQFGALWNLADKNTPTPGTGGYGGAGDNAIFFDNVSVAVPEPSTYAMMVLGFVGLGLVLRVRRQQA